MAIVRFMATRVRLLWDLPRERAGMPWLVRARKLGCGCIYGKRSFPTFLFPSYRRTSELVLTFESSCARIAILVTHFPVGRVAERPLVCFLNTPRNIVFWQWPRGGQATSTMPKSRRIQTAARVSFALLSESPIHLLRKVGVVLLQRLIFAIARWTAAL
jgi:hypothetical protein